MMFPESAYFTCTDCGKCCQSAFEIPVRSDKAKTIEARPLSRELERQGKAGLRQLTESVYFLAQDCEGSCRYFQDQVCALHARYGSNSKPVICQLYPYNIVGTPSGYFISLLYSCPAVVAGSGRSLAAQEAELLAFINSENPPQLPGIKNHILVTSQSTWTWEEYLKWEHQSLKEFSANKPVASLERSLSNLLKAHLELGPEIAESLTQKLRHSIIPEFAALITEYLDTRVGDTLKAEPDTTRDASIIEKFVKTKFSGKLLCLGPNLVARLALFAASLKCLLWELTWRRAEAGIRHFSFQDLADLLALLEEEVLAQSPDFEEQMFQVEEAIMGLIGA